jgi:hypothetical protein
MTTSQALVGKPHSPFRIYTHQPHDGSVPLPFCRNYFALLHIAKSLQSRLDIYIAVVENDALSKLLAC